MDETLAQLTAAIFGEGGDEIVAKFKGETQAEKERRQAKVALAGNVLGLTAGMAALGAAYKNPALKQKGATPKNAGPVTGRAVKHPKVTNLLKTPRGRARLIQAGAIGAVGLQAANTAGDVVGNVVLRREAKKVSKSSPDPADLNTGNEKKKVFLSRGTLTTMAADKTLLGAKKAEPIIVDHGRRISTKAKAKIKKDDTWDGHSSDSSSSSASGSSGRDLDLTWEGEFSKFDTDKRQVFGWASITEINGEPVVDLQGDYITTDEIEKAAYDYVIKSRKGGDMHRRNGAEPHHVSDMIESFMVTPEKKKALGLPDSTPTGWWVGFQVNDDETWDLVKKGNRKGFSIHGKGKRVPKND